MARARSSIRELTGRRRCHVPTYRLVADLNQFLRGWRQYYRWGNSTVRFARIDRYVEERMALLLSKRHARSGRGYGLKLLIGSGNRLGLRQLCSPGSRPMTLTLRRVSSLSRYRDNDDYAEQVIMPRSRWAASLSVLTGLSTGRYSA